MHSLEVDYYTDKRLKYVRTSSFNTWIVELVSLSTQYAVAYHGSTMLVSPSNFFDTQKILLVTWKNEMEILEAQAYDPIRLMEVFQKVMTIKTNFFENCIH